MRQLVDGDSSRYAPLAGGQPHTGRSGCGGTASLATVSRRNLDRRSHRARLVERVFLGRVRFDGVAAGRE